MQNRPRGYSYKDLDPAAKNVAAAVAGRDISQEFQARQLQRKMQVSATAQPLGFFFNNKGTNEVFIPHINDLNGHLSLSFTWHPSLMRDPSQIKKGQGFITDILLELSGLHKKYDKKLVFDAKPVAGKSIDIQRTQQVVVSAPGLGRIVTADDKERIRQIVIEFSGYCYGLFYQDTEGNAHMIGHFNTGRLVFSKDGYRYWSD